ncbi:hypothetical protein [Falsiroseomonas sp.]|uniref:hypothetical protein n=1 Tax=Falsiroseomonas sp. TaxID=2870721 RepID=UPI0034A51746
MSTAPDSPGPGLLPFPDPPERRLRRALGALDAALAEQRGAVAQFRAQLGALRQTVAQLDGSTQALRGRLAGAAQDAARAQGAARDLLVTAAKLEQAAQA